jgi:hypothetical protein
MFHVGLMRIANILALAALLVPFKGPQAGENRHANAAAKLEVRVLEARGQAHVGSGAREAVVIYRMEVISVLRANIRVKPGETIAVRTDALPQETQDNSSAEGKTPGRLAQGWIGIVYLNPTPSAAGSEGPRPFTFAANGDSVEDLPPAPPSARWIKYE